ncbi:PTS sugar transporter subunit IIA [Ruoffia tabacinasalis]|uniref:PTS sugar transporter subunit IIA n=1 Tax=Ruoffia tabacinasalis TaxID=87458 RepID=A0A5R9DTA6_9LACT|nr:PTS transporter subunit EIIC [Ruoffia tabacinasalis]TLQ39976.1 PTS sugar transporter subunit IIA [Ruoffia tabacinasalis]
MGKYDKSIEQLLDVIGGKENIKNYEHCATRLRVVLKDDSKLDKEKADNIEESKGYFFSTGQHQFIFGTGKVNEVTKELDEYLGKSSSDDDGSMKDDIYANLNPVQKVVRILADILVPLIPALVTTGLLMGLRGLLVELGLEMTEDVAGLFAMLTDTAFAFLPVLIAYSATRKFGGNPLLGIVVGLMMVAPQLPNAYDVRGGSASPMNIFGIDIYGYQGSIFPAILAGWMISKLDKWLRTWVPKVMDLIVTPFLTITITIGVILFLLGPIIQVIESFVIDGIVTLINAPLGIGYIVFGALQQLIVITGLHHSIGLIEITLLSDTGLNVIQPLTTVSMAGQFGAAIGAAFLMKDQVKRTNMISSAVPTLFGITEPLLFGVNMRSLRIFGSGIVAGAVGGFLIYLFDLAATGMGITFIPGLLLYTSSLTALTQYIIVSLAAFLVGFILVRLQGKAIREEV